MFFVEHVTTWISRLVTNNGKNYTAKASRRSTCAFIGRHQRTRICTPRRNRKVERFQRITADEFFYAEVFTSVQECRNRHGV